ncbi:hypothetical protein B0I35DRAFT_447459 [Stachybotrys elegans]|uniref:NmrA-like domain-containing protein n=1 Tax=Stachybotrys elegans TaxID=80388 RepID=A0A8K0SCM0_9HYPO|nr:hypothetical protein B0I35DRAFT_447459 [Stachybotrys elegans]
MSSIIAVAGGTGSLGRAIVDALHATAKFTVIVFSRQEVSEEKQKEIGARVISVDYTDAAGLVEVLEKNRIDTVISTMAYTEGPAAELALMQAAERSAVTKRLIPSIWGVPYDRDSDTSDSAVPMFPAAQQKLEVMGCLDTLSLEHTVFYTGYFFDYYTRELPTYMQPVAFVLDIPNNAAAIPGSGEVPVVFTHTWDVAKFVAAYAEKPQWDREAYVIGDKITLNELVRLAEEVKGKKFRVSYDTVEDLLDHKVTELPCYPQIYPFFPKEALMSLIAGIGWLFEKGYFDLNGERTLNEDFKSIKARSTRELLVQASKSK